MGDLNVFYSLGFFKESKSQRVKDTNPFILYSLLNRKIFFIRFFVGPFYLENLEKCGRVSFVCDIVVCRNILRDTKHYSYCTSQIAFRKCIFVILKRKKKIPIVVLIIESINQTLKQFGKHFFEGLNVTLKKNFAQKKTILYHKCACISIVFPYQKISRRDLVILLYSYRQ